MAESGTEVAPSLRQKQINAIKAMICPSLADGSELVEAEWKVHMAK